MLCLYLAYKGRKNVENIKFSIPLSGALDDDTCSLLYILYVELVSSLLYELSAYVLPFIASTQSAQIYYEYMTVQLKPGLRNISTNNVNLFYLEY